MPNVRLPEKPQRRPSTAELAEKQALAELKAKELEELRAAKKALEEARAKERAEKEAERQAAAEKAAIIKAEKEAIRQAAEAARAAKERARQAAATAQLLAEKEAEKELLRKSREAANKTTKWSGSTRTPSSSQLNIELRDRSRLLVFDHICHGDRVRRAFRSSRRTAEASDPGARTHDAAFALGLLVGNGGARDRLGQDHPPVE